MTATESSAGRSRIAEPGEGIGLDELALAARNHGMPLEALRYDVTPPGLHYLLIALRHPARRRRRLAAARSTALVERPLRFDLDATPGAARRHHPR